MATTVPYDDDDTNGNGCKASAPGSTAVDGDGGISSDNNTLNLPDCPATFGLQKGSRYIKGLEIVEPPTDQTAMVEKEEYMATLMGSYVEHLQHKTAYHLGYPLNSDFDFSSLAHFLNFSLKNDGDPFAGVAKSEVSVLDLVNSGAHSREFEVAVLDWFAHLWDLQKDYWGYITSGGTEGNLYGLLIGREIFPDGLLYASHDSHYSVFKAAKMYRLECVKIDTLTSGEMNCEDFKNKLLQNTKSPAIINVNIGTTLKGAIDDLDQIIRTLEQCGFQNRYYIHCDGALSGIMLPFMKHAPELSFKKPIGSISISGHKFIGCPVPCGVVITRLEHADIMSAYISSRNATIIESRNGHAPIFLWCTLSKKGRTGISAEVQMCLGNARYLEHLLKKFGVSASLNALSTTVVFERPKDEAFVCRWQLACSGNLAHVVVMPSVTKEKLTLFAEEFAEKRRGWYQDNGFCVPCIAVDLGQENCCCDLHREIPKVDDADV